MTRSVRGVRDRIPGAHVLGRDESGLGPVKPLSIELIANAVAQIFAGGSAKNATGKLIRAPASVFSAFTGGTPQVGFFADRPLADGGYLGAVTFTKTVTFASGWGGVGSAGRPATADATMDIRKNGVSVGSILFATGATSAIFSGSATFNAGDRMQFYLPTPQDATLGDISGTLIGTAG